MYGILITFGVFISIFLAERVLKSAKYPEHKYVWEIAIFCMVFGVLGARLYHVVDFYEYYMANPLQVFNLRAGGLGLYGGVLGGCLGLYAASWRYKAGFKNLLDVCAIVMPLGQSIGRWGNYFNFELYGKPTDSFLGIYIPLEHRISNVQEYSYFHPLFFYESAGTLIAFFVLYVFFIKKRFKIGSLNFFFLYLVLYGALRFGLEFFRIDPWSAWGIPVAAIISIILVFAGAVGMMGRFRKLFNL